MKTWRQMLALLLSLALVVSLCACGDPAEVSPPNESASVSPDVSQVPEPTAAVEVDLSQDIIAFSAGLSGDDVLLTVNGEDITADLFLYLLFQNCYYLEVEYYYSYGFFLDIAAAADMLLEDTVFMLQYYTVCRQKAAELGCLLTDEQQAALEARKTGENAETYARNKSAFGLTDEDMDFIPVNNYFYENLLYAITHEPSEQELREYLDGQGVFYVKHILLKTTDGQNHPLSEDEIAEKRTLADDLLGQLQTAEDMPSKFDELMKTYSEDPGVISNPDGYVFDSSDSLVGGFREAALELEEGQLSGIVETDYGYHIMLRLALTDELEESYRTYFRQEALEDQMTQWMEPIETVRADALAGIDVADFYDRYYAYYSTALKQYEAAGGDAAD